MSLLEQLTSSVSDFITSIPAPPYTPDHFAVRTQDNDIYASYKRELTDEGSVLLRSTVINGREIAVFVLPHPICGFAYLEVAQPKAGEELYTDVEHVAYICPDLDELHKTYTDQVRDQAAMHILVHPLKTCNGSRYFKIFYNDREIEFRDVSVLIA